MMNRFRFKVYEEQSKQEKIKPKKFHFKKIKNTEKIKDIIKKIMKKKVKKIKRRRK